MKRRALGTPGLVLAGALLGVAAWVLACTPLPTIEDIDDPRDALLDFDAGLGASSTALATGFCDTPELPSEGTLAPSLESEATRRPPGDQEAKAAAFLWSLIVLGGADGRYDSALVGDPEVRNLLTDLSATYPRLFGCPTSAPRSLATPTTDPCATCSPPLGTLGRTSSSLVDFTTDAVLGAPDLVVPAREIARRVTEYRASHEGVRIDQAIAAAGDVAAATALLEKVGAVTAQVAGIVTTPSPGARVIAGLGGAFQIGPELGTLAEGVSRCLVLRRTSGCACDAGAPDAGGACQ